MRTVLLSTGETKPLTCLMDDTGVLLVFLRHFGCCFGKEQVKELRMDLPVPVAFVSQDDQDRTETYRKVHRSPHPFICDPERQLAEAYGIRRGGVRQVFAPKIFSRGFGAFLKGNLISLPIGDLWQLPGIVLVGPDERVLWAHHGKDAADNLSADQLQEILAKRVPSPNPLGR